MITGRKRKALFLAFLSSIAIAMFILLWKHSIYSEPPFIIIGNSELLKKTHINVYMFRYESRSLMKTIFLNGHLYPSDNQNVDRFELYINYNNKLFSHYGYDNIPRMMNDASIARNTLLICNAGDDIFFSNQSINCENPNNQIKLRPLDEQIKFELIDNDKYENIKTKSEKELFVNNVKTSFFEISIPKK